MISCCRNFLFAAKWPRWLLPLLSFALVIFSGAMNSTPATAQGSTDHWLGWYAGGALGISWTDVDIAILPNNFSESYDGISGGLVGGNNFYVTDEHLAGIEADITFADLSGGVTLARHKVSLLGRVGRFWSPSTLLFAVGGLAGGQYEAKVTTTQTTTTTTMQTRTEIVFDEENESEIVVTIPFTTLVTSTSTASTKRKKRLWGLTLGAGFERQAVLANRQIRWGAEYRYTNFEDWDFSFRGQAFSIDPEVHELRFRLVVPFQRAAALPLK